LETLAFGHNFAFGSGENSMAKNRSRNRVISVLLSASVFFIALASWALASPVGASPDEDYHLVSIWCGQGERQDICAFSADKPGEVVVPTALVEAANCFAFHPELSANCPIKPTTTSTSRSNADGGYPPVFYWVMSAFVSSDIVVSVLLMRLFNALLFCALIATSFLTLGRKLRVPMLWGLAITIVPLGMFLIPSVNPSSWALMSASILWVTLTGFFSAASLRQRLALGFFSLFATLIGAGARSDSAVYAGLAALVAVILSWRLIVANKRLLAWPAALIVIAIAFFVAGGQSSVITPNSNEATSIAGGTLNFAIANLALLPQLWVGVLGTWGLGWLDTTMPGIVWVTTISIFSGFVFAGLKNMPRKKTLALSIIFASLVAIPLYILVNDRVMVGAGVQPRYIFPLVILLAGVSLIFLRQGIDTLGRAQVWVAVAGLGIANSLALHTNIRRYVTGVDVNGVNLDASPEWWWSLPVGPMWIWAVGSISGIAILMLLARWTRRQWDPERFAKGRGTPVAGTFTAGSPAADYQPTSRTPLSPPW
jgi:hypothetical protein